MSDEITLVVPAQEDFRHIAHLVVGGLGARLDLTYEDLDDLQTAIEALLGRRDDDGEMRISIDVGSPTVRATIGPFGESELATLGGDGSALGLRRVLETVTDGFDVEHRDGSSWVVLTKNVVAAAEAAG